MGLRTRLLARLLGAAPAPAAPAQGPARPPVAPVVPAPVVPAPAVTEARPAAAPLPLAARTVLQPSADAPVRTAHHRGATHDTDAAVHVILVDPRSGAELRFPCEPDEPLLDAAERAGHDLPSSCRSGGCLSCAARLLDGEVEMEEQYTLDDEHIRSGFRLLCVTRPRGPCRLLAFQQDEVG